MGSLIYNCVVSNLLRIPGWYTIDDGIIKKSQIIPNFNLSFETKTCSSNWKTGGTIPKCTLKRKEKSSSLNNLM